MPLTCEYPHENVSLKRRDRMMMCNATTIVRDADEGMGKWRRCELSAGHDGEHETIYCGHPYRWSDKPNSPQTFEITRAPEEPPITA